MPKARDGAGGFSTKEVSTLCPSSAAHWFGQSTSLCSLWRHAHLVFGILVQSCLHLLYWSSTMRIFLLTIPPQLSRSSLEGTRQSGQSYRMARHRAQRVRVLMRVAALGALVGLGRGSAVNSGVEDGDPEDKYGVDTTTAETGADLRNSRQRARNQIGPRGVRSGDSAV